MKVTMSGKISLVEAMTKQKKNDEEQVFRKDSASKDSVLSQLRSSLTTIIWNDPHIVSFFL